jgi:multiple sugar transport system substrate-binding protein
MSQMVIDKDLYQIYGGMPAIVADRPDFFKGLDERTAPNKVNWAVAEEMLQHPDLPNHEAWLPNLVKANDAFAKFRKLLDTQPGLNIDAEIDKFQTELDGIFKQPAS